MICDRISSRTWKYLVVLLCSLGGHAVNIIPFSYGILQVYVHSYIYKSDKQVTKADMHIHAPVVLGMATGTAWTFGIFVKYVHPIVLHVVNGLALSGWMILLYFFTDDYIAITITMACVGFHLGQLHVFFSQRVTEEAEDNPARANGFYGFWFGVAGIWGNLLGVLYFNPDNLPRETFIDVDGKQSSLFIQEEILNKVSNLWLILAALLFIGFLPGYFVIGLTRKGRKPSIRGRMSSRAARARSTSIISRVVEDAYAHNLDDESEPAKKRGPTMNELTKLKEASRNVSIFSGIGVVLFATTVGIGVSSLCAFELFKEFGTSGDKQAGDDKFFNVAGIVIPVVGAFGRIMWGILGDKIPYKILFIVGNVLTIVLQITMAPGRVSRYLYIVIVAVLAVMPGLMTLLPPAIKSFMGSQDIGLKFGLVLTGEVFGCGYYLIFAGVLRKHLSDLLLMVVLSVPAMVALPLTFYFLPLSTDQGSPTVIENKSQDQS